MSRTDRDPGGDLYLNIPHDLQAFLVAAARHAGISLNSLLIEGIALALKRLRIPVPADLNDERPPYLPEVYP